MIKNISNTVKIFRSTLVLRASASCSKILNSEKIFNTVYSVHIHFGVIRVIWRIDITDEAVTKEFNCTDQIYKRFHAPFGLN